MSESPAYVALISSPKVERLDYLGRICHRWQMGSDVPYFDAPRAYIPDHMNPMASIDPHVVFESSCDAVMTAKIAKTAVAPHRLGRLSRDRRAPFRKPIAYGSFSPLHRPCIKFRQTAEHKRH